MDHIGNDVSRVRSTNYTGTQTVKADVYAFSGYANSR